MPEKRLTSKDLSINHNGFNLDVSLVYLKKKNLSLHISRDSTIEVRAPRNIPEQDIQKFIIKKFNWITNNLDKLSANILISTDYEKVDYFYYFGKKLSIKRIVCADNSVDIDSNWLVIKHKEKKSVNDLIGNYVKQISQDFYIKKVEHYISLLGKYQFNPKQVKCRVMKSRWGSCSSNGILTFNTRLIHVPEYCIDYVIIHELCHLKHFNHGKNFHALQKSILPNYKVIKNDLNRYVFIS